MSARFLLILMLAALCPFRALASVALYSNPCVQQLAILTGNIPYIHDGEPIYLKDRRALPGNVNKDDVIRYIRLVAEELGLTSELQTGYSSIVPKLKLTNVIVNLKFNRSPKKIVIGAHYDSAGPFEAADDNGTGVVALYELMARLKDKKLNTNLEFVFFDAEEPVNREGLLGSSLYVEKIWYWEKINIKQVVVLDMLGRHTPERPGAIGVSYNEKSSDNINPFLASQPENADFRANPLKRGYISRSDAIHFDINAMPVVLFCDVLCYDFYLSYAHTKADTLASIEWDYFFHSVDKVEQFITQIAGK
jgi:Zn-dependent M28 family amino/carboxypeptidase